MAWSTWRSNRDERLEPAAQRPCEAGAGAARRERPRRAGARGRRPGGRGDHRGDPRGPPRRDRDRSRRLSPRAGAASLRGEARGGRARARAGVPAARRPRAGDAVVQGRDRRLAGSGHLGMAIGEDLVTQRTYWHLTDLGRKPTDYDIASTRLLYYPERGFETAVPLAAWYRRHQHDSELVCHDWERFRDPRETTYSRYVELQRTKEAFVDGVLAAGEGSERDRLSPAWLATLAELVPPLRYAVHGLQMVAAYIGSMAPSGRIVIASMLQAADETRRIERLAYRMRQLQYIDPSFGE